MAVFKCKMCGGSLEIQPNSSIALCESCGSQQTIPLHLDDEERFALYDRANHFRRNSEFDKAVAIYEQILNKDKNDAEAYWSLVLCKYGVTYVEDPTTHKRVPTVNRAQYTSIFDDEDFKSAYSLADTSQKKILDEEAGNINAIQKGIIEISEKEEPFDVFICYKETDEYGRRTKDSVLANELYHELTKEGLNVFFARITLEDKLGTEYEPYIFAALHSAKVMVVIGTNEKYFNAVWVKNEWSRFLALIKSGEKKVLIPAYKDMDPYDLPREFSHLQAQDMSKLGFIQDLIRGIKKITNTDNTLKTQGSAIQSDSLAIATSKTQAQAFLKRGYMFLDDISCELEKSGFEKSDWNIGFNWNYRGLSKVQNLFQSANEYFDRVLDLDPECSFAYLGKFLVEKEIPGLDYLPQLIYCVIKHQLFTKALNFAKSDEKKKLEAFVTKIKDNTYNTLVKRINETKDIGVIESAIYQLEEIISVKDTKHQIDLAKEKFNALKYNMHVARISVSNDVDAIKKEIDYLEDIRFYKDTEHQIELANEKILSLKYNEYVGIINNSNDITEIWFKIESLNEIINYKDAEYQIKLAKEKIDRLLIALMKDILSSKNLNSCNKQKEMTYALAYASVCSSNSQQIKALVDEIEKIQLKSYLYNERTQDKKELETAISNGNYCKKKYIIKKGIFFLILIGLLGSIAFTLSGLIFLKHLPRSSLPSLCFILGPIIFVGLAILFFKNLPRRPTIFVPIYYFNIKNKDYKGEEHFLETASRVINAYSKKKPLDEDIKIELSKRLLRGTSRSYIFYLYDIKDKPYDIVYNAVFDHIIGKKTLLRNPHNYSSKVLISILFYYIDMELWAISCENAQSFNKRLALLKKWSSSLKSMLKKDCIILKINNKSEK